MVVPQDTQIVLRFVSELAMSVAGGRKLDRFRPAKKEVIMMERIFLLVLFLTTAAASTTWAATPAPSGAELYFISPKNGEVVNNPVVVRFGLKGMGVLRPGFRRPTPVIILLINTAYYARQADSQGRTARPFRRRTDRDDAHTSARQAYTAVIAWGLFACPASATGRFQGHYDQCTVTTMP
jgi:hypothetical protein